MKSVNDLANDIGCTKTAVFQHIKQNRNKLKGHTKLIKNKKYLDNTAYSILIKSFHLNKNNLQSNYKRSAMYLLKSELDKKDKQIDNLNQELKQSQTLQLNTQQELKAVRHQLKLTNHSSSTYQKHGFFWKLFH